MTLSRFVFIVSCLTIAAWSAAKADAPGVHLVREGGNDHLNPIDEQLHRAIKWSHGGYLLMDGIGGEPPVFYNVDRAGDWTDTAQFRNPEPTRFYAHSYDRQSDGTIVFSGQTETAPRVESPFLAWTSADGQIQRMFRTENYFAYHVAVAPDDTIWTLGYEMVNLNANDPAVNQEAHILRHFDRTGNLIASAFPQSQVSRLERYRLATGVFAVSSDRLGWYGPQNGEAAYTEVSLDTMTMKEYPGVPSQRGKFQIVGGLALTKSGVAAVSIQDNSPLACANYILDRASGEWTPVSVPAMGGFKFTPHLIGSDGDFLVFKYGRESGFFRVLE